METYIYIYIYKNLTLAGLACRCDGKVWFHHGCAHKLKKNGFWNCFSFNFCAQVWAKLKKWFEKLWKASLTKSGPRINKNAKPREAVWLFRSERPNYHGFLMIVHTSDFRWQARWFCTVLQKHHACAQSAFSPRLCIKISVRKSKTAPKREFWVGIVRFRHACAEKCCERFQGCCHTRAFTRALRPPLGHLSRECKYIKMNICIYIFRYI